MVLLFDIGNTNIVLGLCQEGKILNTFRFVTNAKLTEDDYFQKINMALNDKAINENLEGAIISSVVPQLDNVFINLVKKYYHLKPLIIGPGLKSDLKLKIENTKQLGADLLCDALGAYNKYGGPAIIVDMGTATKLIVVSKNKEFLGGAICAGIQGSLDSLINTTSKLSRTFLEVPDKFINNETSACIQSGIVYGHICMIDGLVKKFINELNDPNTKVILTGGYSVIIKDYLECKPIYDENILLEGLYSVYQKNQK